MCNTDDNLIVEGPGMIWAAPSPPIPHISKFSSFYFLIYVNVKQVLKPLIISCDSNFQQCAIFKSFLHL